MDKKQGIKENNITIARGIVINLIIKAMPRFLHTDREKFRIVY